MSRPKEYLTGKGETPINIDTLTLSVDFNPVNQRSWKVIFPLLKNKEKKKGVLTPINLGKHNNNYLKIPIIN